MIYVVAGVLSSALMLFYRSPPGKRSPLHRLSRQSTMLDRRLTAGPNRVASGVALFASFAILCIIAASRRGIGTDYWRRLIPTFQEIQFGVDVDSEPGFVALNRAVQVFTDDPQWLVAVLSVLTIALIYRFIIRMSLDPALSVFVFVFGGFFLEVFNLAQQGLAIAILLNTIEFALRKNYLALILGTALAATIHSSALVWIVVWPLLLFRFGRVWRVVMIALAAIILTWAPQLLVSLAEGLAPEYAWYLTSDYGVARSVNPSVVFSAVSLCILCVIVVRAGDRGDVYPDAVVNLLIVGVLLLFATLTIAYFFSRLIYYFSPVQMIALPLLLSAISNVRLRAVARVVFMTIIFAAFVLQFLVWNAHGVLPYDSVLTP